MDVGVQAYLGTCSDGPAKRTPIILVAFGRPRFCEFLIKYRNVDRGRFTAFVGGHSTFRVRLHFFFLCTLRYCDRFYFSRPRDVTICPFDIINPLLKRI